MKYRYLLIALSLTIIVSCQKKESAAPAAITTPRKADSTIQPVIVTATYPYTDTFAGRLADSFYENGYYVPTGPPVSLVTNNSFTFLVKHITADSIVITNPNGILLDQADNLDPVSWTISFATKTNSSGTYAPRVKEGNLIFTVVKDSLYLSWYNLFDCGQELSMGGFSGKK